MYLWRASLQSDMYVPLAPRGPSDGQDAHVVARSHALHHLRGNPTIPLFTLQSHKAVTAYFSSKQLPLFDIARQYSIVYQWAVPSASPGGLCLRKWSRLFGRVRRTVSHRVTIVPDKNHSHPINDK